VVVADEVPVDGVADAPLERPHRFFAAVVVGRAASWRPADVRSHQISGS
jgi:hypothetical protein